MSASVLERMSTEIPEQESTCEFGQQLHCIVGYKGLLKPIKNVKLFCELISIGIIPFTENSVNEYKEDKILQLHLREFKIASIVVVLSMLITSIFLYYLISENAHAHTIGIWELILSKLPREIFILVGGGAVGLFGCVIFDLFKQYAWNNIHLKQYTKPIPISILQKILIIKKNINSAEFQICELVTVKSDDPFLVVTYYNDEIGCMEEYYVDVWDEPSFKNS